MHETKTIASIAKSFNIQAEIISPSEAKNIYPTLNKECIEGAIYIPKDGQTNPVDTTMSLIAGAKKLGVSVHENIEVIDLKQNSDQSFSVFTKDQVINCEKLIIACGRFFKQRKPVQCTFRYLKWGCFIRFYFHT